MKQFKAVVLVWCLLFAVKASAEGALSFSVQSREGFTKFELIEQNGVVSGDMFSIGGARPVKSYARDNYLYMDLWEQGASLKIEGVGNTLYYSGRLWHAVDLSSFAVYMDKGVGFRIAGNIVTSLFQVWVDSNKKTLQMEWGGTLLDVSGNPDPDQGDCKGRLYDEQAHEEVGTFRCKSSGKLEDAFFKIPNQVIAWVVYFLVTPSQAQHY